MRQALRTEDVYGRWGGDEFLVSAPRTPTRPKRVLVPLERLRRAGRDVSTSATSAWPDGVPMSIGSATGRTISPEDLVQQADLALYEQKTARRHGAGTQSHQLELSNPLEPLASPAKRRTAGRAR